MDLGRWLDSPFARRLAPLRGTSALLLPRLAAGLTALGCQVCPGEANFLLFFSPVPDLGERLRKRGILLRDCSNYRGLGPGWYRASVRTGEENQALLQTIREVL